jgi:plastocyanin
MAQSPIGMHCADRRSMVARIVKLITDLCGDVPFRPQPALLAVTCAWVALLPAAGHAVPAYGRITGIVHLVAPGGTPLRSGAYPSRQVNHKTPDAAEIANVVLFVKDAPSEPDLPATRSTIAQRDEAFVPKVTAITRGSVIEFPNFDPYFHNVFSLSRGASFDLGRFRRGEKRERPFPRAGVIKVYCHIHSEMAATILVFDHRLYTTPSANGTFSIETVPAGTYRLSAWHERIGETTKTVQVAGGESASVEFSLPVVER